jgi:hypothetical protein
MPAGAGVAQLVEQWFCKPQVGGSTPSAGTINSHIEGFNTQNNEMLLSENWWKSEAQVWGRTA